MDKQLVETFQVRGDIRHQVEHGATTIWERWNSIKENGNFGPVSMNSLNHYAYGAIAEWLYRYVSGINPVESEPGFKHIRLAPLPNDKLSFAEASVDTQYGLVRSFWELENDKLYLQFEVPFNTTATIILPDAEGVDILENGRIVHGPAFERSRGPMGVYLHAEWQHHPRPRAGGLLAHNLIGGIVLIDNSDCGFAYHYTP